jgi:hypothetical protein
VRVVIADILFVFRFFSWGWGRGGEDIVKEGSLRLWRNAFKAFVEENVLAFSQIMFCFHRKKDVLKSIYYLCDR